MPQMGMVRHAPDWRRTKFEQYIDEFDRYEMALGWVCVHVNPDGRQCQQQTVEIRNAGQAHFSYDRRLADEQQREAELSERNRLILGTSNRRAPRAEDSDRPRMPRRPGGTVGDGFHYDDQGRLRDRRGRYARNPNESPIRFPGADHGYMARAADTVRSWQDEAQTWPTNWNDVRLTVENTDTSRFANQFTEAYRRYST